MGDARKRIYIAGPISKGDLLHNVRQADEAFLALLRAGFAPFCPHWSVYHGSAERHGPNLGRVIATADAKPNGTTHADWMGVDLPWVAVAEGVLRLPGVSTGADAEVAHAHRHGVPVFGSVQDAVDHFSGKVPVAAWVNEGEAKPARTPDEQRAFVDLDSDADE